MKASEALNIYENVVSENLDDVYKIIAESAKNRKRSCYYYKTLSDAQLHTLGAGDGYKVSNETDRDGVMYKIEW